MKRAWILALVAVVSIIGCGRRREQPAPELKFELQGDTAGLSQGKPLLNKIEPYRAANGVLRVRGDVSFPDGVRIQISMYRKDTNEMLSRVQVIVDNHRFESPPIIGPGGPLPHGDYRFEYLSLFNRAWQSDDVMRRTDRGRSLRGPGVTRDRVGAAAFYLVEERTL